MRGCHGGTRNSVNGGLGSDPGEEDVPEKRQKPDLVNGVECLPGAKTSTHSP